MSGFIKIISVVLKMDFAYNFAEVEQASASESNGRNISFKGGADREGARGSNASEHLFPYCEPPYGTFLWRAWRLPRALDGDYIPSFARAHTGWIDLFSPQWPIHFLPGTARASCGIPALPREVWRKICSCQK